MSVVVEVAATLTKLLRIFTMNIVPKRRRMIWVDCEMTGLNIHKDTILEVACVVTDRDLKMVAEGCTVVISHPKIVLDNMSDWCRRTFGQNGLYTELLASKLSMQDAEQKLLSYVREHTEAGKCPLAGNSVGTDRAYLEKCMPEFAAHLHYRIIDVSTIKELVKRWNPKLYAQFPGKQNPHRAMNDIQESIKELAWYKEHIFDLAN